MIRYFEQIYLFSVPGRSENVNTYGFHDRGKANSFHSADSKMFYSGSAVKFGHGSLDSGSIAISIFEIRTLFVAFTFRKIDVLIFITIIKGFAPFLDGTDTETFTVKTCFQWENCAEPFFGFLDCGVFPRGHETIRPS